MSWVPRVVGPLLRAVRQIGYRKAAYTAAKQTIKAISKKPKAKKAPMVKKSTASIGPMPFYRRRRFARRKPLYRRRRYGKKTVNKIHTFVRWCDKDSTYGQYGPNTITETNANQHLTYQFKLDQVAGVSDFVNLYDGYKINKIQLFLEPTFDQTGAAGAVNPIQRKIRVVHDYNDATPLTDEDDYLQYGNCKSYFMWSKRGIRITLYPKLNNVIENVDGAATGYTSLNSNRQFLNIATDEVPHFGIKMFIPANVASLNATLFRVRAKMWLSMRGTK